VFEGGHALVGSEGLDAGLAGDPGVVLALVAGDALGVVGVHESVEEVVGLTIHRHDQGEYLESGASFQTGFMTLR